MKLFTTANMTVQERHWKWYKEICAKRKSRTGELSAKQFDMMAANGYSGPMQSRACILTEVRANFHVMDNDSWRLATDGTWIDTNTYNITDKMYQDFTRFYEHEVWASTDPEGNDESIETNNPAYNQHPRVVNCYFEEHETFMVKKTNHNRATLTKKYKELFLKTKGGQVYVIDSIAWQSDEKSYVARISPLGTSGGVNRADKDSLKKMRLNSGIWNSIKRATECGYNTAIDFKAKPLQPRNASKSRTEIEILSDESDADEEQGDEGNGEEVEEAGVADGISHSDSEEVPSEETAAVSQDNDVYTGVAENLDLQLSGTDEPPREATVDIAVADTDDDEEVMESPQVAHTLTRKKKKKPAKLPLSMTGTQESAKKTKPKAPTKKKPAKNTIPAKVKPKKTKNAIPAAPENNTRDTTADTQVAAEKTADTTVTDDAEKTTDTTVTDDVEKTTDTTVTDDAEKTTDTTVTDDVEKTTDTTVTDDVEKTTDTTVTDDVEKTTDTTVTDDVEKTTDTTVTDDVEKTTDTTVTDDVEKTTDTTVTDDVEKTTDTTVTDDAEPTDTIATDTVEKTISTEIVHPDIVVTEAVETEAVEKASGDAIVDETDLEAPIVSKSKDSGGSDHAAGFATPDLGESTPQIALGHPSNISASNTGLHSIPSPAHMYPHSTSSSNARAYSQQFNPFASAQRSIQHSYPPPQYPQDRSMQFNTPDYPAETHQFTHVSPA